MLLDNLFARIRRNCEAFSDQFPTVGDGTRYLLQPNDTWLAAFWPGLLWLTYAATADPAIRSCAESLLPSFADRLERRVHITHDLGFLYTLSARAQWQLTGDEAAHRLALRAAEELARRYRPAGQYIQAWGEIGDKAEGGRAIIDTMMNVHLLFWAAEQTGRTHYHDIARAHVDTTASFLVRADGSSNHTFFFDQNTGEPLGPRTHQGYADDSLWARGQGWTIHGFAAAADWTGDPHHAAIARQAAERFLAELPEGGIPTWDLRLPADAPHYPDTSASAIAAAGMLRLARQLGGEAGDHMRRAAVTLLDTLIARYLETDSEGQGLLRGGTYHAHKGWGVDAYFICGDYFFLEALLMRDGRCPSLWGPGADRPHES
jgi:unsaturated chondroitin disaccharide hydrolase